MSLAVVLSIVALVISLGSVIFTGLTWRENRRMADAAKESVEIEKRDRLGALEVVDVRWTVPDEGPLRVCNEGTTDARDVRAEFTLDGERFRVTRPRVGPGESVGLPSESEVPRDEVKRRSLLLGFPDGTFPGAAVRVIWRSEHGPPTSFEGERPPDVLMTIW